jgi:uncharacterized protein with HEPN domain
VSRNVVLYVQDIVEALRNVVEFTAGTTQADFFDDKKTRDATIRNLEIIGEAAKRVPDAIRVLAPDIPWRRVAGLRDILAHDYFGIDQTILWDVIVNEIPTLLTKFVRLDELITRQ